MLPNKEKNIILISSANKHNTKNPLWIFPAKPFCIQINLQWFRSFQLPPTITTHPNPNVQKNMIKCLLNKIKCFKKNLQSIVVITPSFFFFYFVSFRSFVNNVCRLPPPCRKNIFVYSEWFYFILSYLQDYAKESIKMNPLIWERHIFYISFKYRTSKNTREWAEYTI